MPPRCCSYGGRNGRSAIAIGRVSGWGRAVSHTRGRRSELAYPHDLHLLRGDRALAQALARRYAVEVSPFPPDT